MANERARYLRRNQTDAERRLWRHLRSLRSAGYHFRRQVPIDGYIVDFVCFAARLVVEVDGGQHGFESNLERDKQRDANLEAQGFCVLRFWNNEVMDNLHGVAHMIERALEASPERLSRTL